MTKRRVFWRNTHSLSAASFMTNGPRADSSRTRHLQRKVPSENSYRGPSRCSSAARRQSSICCQCAAKQSVLLLPVGLGLWKSEGKSPLIDKIRSEEFPGSKSRKVDSHAVTIRMKSCLNNEAQTVNREPSDWNQERRDGPLCALELV